MYSIYHFKFVKFTHDFDNKIIFLYSVDNNVDFIGLLEN